MHHLLSRRRTAAALQKLFPPAGDSEITWESRLPVPCPTFWDPPPTVWASSNWWTDPVTPHLVQQRALPLSRGWITPADNIAFCGAAATSHHHHRAPCTAPDWKQEADQSAVFRNRQEVRRLGGKQAACDDFKSLAGREVLFCC